MGEVKPVRVVSEEGRDAMVLESLGVEGDRVMVYGKLMGAWPSKMYIDVESMANAIQMALNTPELLGFALRVPELLKAMKADSESE